MRAYEQIKADKDFFRTLQEEKQSNCEHELYPQHHSKIEGKVKYDYCENCWKVYNIKKLSEA